MWVYYGEISCVFNGGPSLLESKKHFHSDDLVPPNLLVTDQNKPINAKESSSSHFH